MKLKKHQECASTVENRKNCKELLVHFLYTETVHCTFLGETLASDLASDFVVQPSTSFLYSEECESLSNRWKTYHSKMILIVV